MKKLKKFLFAAFTVAILSCLLCQPAFAAISESDVQAQVDAVGKEAVSGNVFIWFLCANPLSAYPESVFCGSDQ